METGHVMDITDAAEAFRWQAEHCEKNGSPCTARVIRALGKLDPERTQVGQRIAQWDGLRLKDAMPLRIHGGMHNLVLSGADKRLAQVYAGEVTDQSAIDPLVAELAETYDAELLPWFDGPPQTNEAGRSASVMAGLLWLAGRLGPRFEMIEIGASAGVNTMMERYHYTLGAVETGPSSSPMRIAPEWRGASPPDNPVEILRSAGCDQQIVDLSDPASALRLKSYVWPDATERLGRIDAAIRLASDKAPDLVQMDAAQFVAQQIKLDQGANVTRVLYHSIMWQYMPAETQDTITRAMEEAGAVATPERPLAWIALETDPATFRHELKVRYWNGSGKGAEPELLAFAHAHGAWVEWLG